MTRRMAPRLIQAFRANRNGNVAMIFALTSIPVMFLLGAGVDSSRGSTRGAKVQADLDATTLALCKSTTTTTADLRKTAETMLADYSPTYPVTIDTLHATPYPPGV